MPSPAAAAGALTWTSDGQRLVRIGYDDRQDGGDTTPDGGSSLYSARPDGSDRRTPMSGYDLRAIAAAPDGTLAIARAGIPASIDCATHPPVPHAEIVLLAPDGRVRVLTQAPVSTAEMVFSPDGTVLAWRAFPGDPRGGGVDSQLFLTDLTTAPATTQQVAGDARRSGWPSFSPSPPPPAAASSPPAPMSSARTWCAPTSPPPPAGACAPPCPPARGATTAAPTPVCGASRSTAAHRPG